MPIYEYQCADCGHKLEVMQRISEPLLKTCPDCAKDSLKKLISAVGFQLKGTGWYETDFKHGAKGKAEKSGEQDGAAKSTDSADKKAEPAKTESSSTTSTGSSTASAAE
jgi:putative FmdB family regulatory protein